MGRCLTSELVIADTISGVSNTRDETGKFLVILKKKKMRRFYIRGEREGEREKGKRRK